MNYTVREIEEAILAALAPVSTTGGGAARMVASYEGQFENAATGNAQMIVLYPAVLIAFLGSTFDPSCAPTFERSMRFAVYCASANTGSELARRRGACALLDATRALLNHNSLGLDISPLIVESESVVTSSRSISVYVGEYALVTRETSAF